MKQLIALVALTFVSMIIIAGEDFMAKWDPEKDSRICIE